MKRNKKLWFRNQFHKELKKVQIFIKKLKNFSVCLDETRKTMLYYV